MISVLLAHRYRLYTHLPDLQLGCQVAPFRQQRICQVCLSFPDAWHLELCLFVNEGYSCEHIV